jgi:hypothetical protein
MTTKKEITNELNRLKQFGFTVITFNDNRPLRSSQKSFVDHFIFNNKYLIFIEVKIGRDQVSPIQEITARKLSACAIYNKYTFYKVIRNVEEAKRLTEHSLKGDL